MKTPFLRSPYNYDRNEASNKTGLHCKDPSLTDQTFKDSCDLNKLAERYELTGTMPQVLRMPTYGDFTGVFDFQSALNAVRSADEGFMELPAKLRARFNNDPQRLLEFLHDESNREEAEKLGLVTKKQTPENGPVSVGTVGTRANTVPNTGENTEKANEIKEKGTK